MLLSLGGVALAACENAGSSKPASVPDNVLEDRPIVLKEGQAIVLVPESDKSVMIAAAVSDGKLSINEIDPNGKNFGVTWHDKDSWETSTIVSGEFGPIILVDHDGDGLPNVKIESGREKRSRRFDFDRALWIETPAEPHQSQQATGANR